MLRASQVLEPSASVVPLWLFSSCDRGIFQVLGQMKMDMVNYTIQSLQPQMQEHSIQFERAQFQERLNKEPSMYAVRRERAARPRPWT